MYHYIGSAFLSFSEEIKKGNHSSYVKSVFFVRAIRTLFNNLFSRKDSTALYLIGE
jgi:hypothetical protein